MSTARNRQFLVLCSQVLHSFSCSIQNHSGSRGFSPHLSEVTNRSHRVNKTSRNPFCRLGCCWPGGRSQLRCEVGDVGTGAAEVMDHILTRAASWMSLPLLQTCSCSSPQPRTRSLCSCSQVVLIAFRWLYCLFSSSCVGQLF